MELLTAELRASLPPLYSQEQVSDPIVHLQVFHARLKLDVVRHGRLSRGGRLPFLRLRLRNGE